MRIERVHIEHYRSIKDLTYRPGPYCVLVGENNSGKSNILRAMNLVLGEYWPSERQFSEEDFHDQDTTKDIVIQVFFDEPIEEWRNKYKVSVGGFELRCKAYKRRVGKKPAGSLSVDFTCLKPDSKPSTYPSEPLGDGRKPRWLPVPVSSRLRDLAPSFIYVDVLRDYHRQAPGSRWSVLRKLFNEVNTEFLNDKTEVHITGPDGSETSMTRKQAFEESIKHAHTFLRTKSFTEIEELLAKNTIHQMGLDEESSKVELYFGTHDPTNVFKSLELYIDQLGIRSPASEVGAGLQSAIVVAIFRTYEELKKEGAVFAIEEPEVYLHPQKARYFESVLRALSTKGNQVILTTHSPVFVQIHDPDSVALVRRNVQEGSTVGQAKATDLADSDRAALRLFTEFDAHRNELFFAKRVLLVEGNTEKVAMPFVFAAQGIDINKENISIVECGGKTLMPLFVRVAVSLGIPCVALVDRDVREIRPEWSEDRQRNQSKKNEKHEKWNKAIVDAAGKERVFFLDPTFEDELGLSSDDSRKVHQALEHFSAIQKDDIPSCLLNPVETLLLAGVQSSGAVSENTLTDSVGGEGGEAEAGVD